MDVDTKLRRFSKLWLEDGNIVIQAGNSQFRVHRSTLAACSPVFQDMFPLPQPPDSDSELVDGCPLVQLHDSAKEVKAFLKAIFTPGYFMPFPAETKYATIQGCLRLSHKYGVE
ncbi:hypothetical protein FB45DRAFT_1065528 [Roridomyces roridus]|uniref:BTB domain-containing protein n=1 Tax=Roridomyces roridus TaxID=1738132 RepID=A0AAD7B7E8_9AGAR|nr:hypothetical protein FB45DRAFT_1065528 [Roridomyces roridus]